MDRQKTFTFPPELLFLGALFLYIFLFFLQISIPWVESQIEEVNTLRDSIALLKSLASQSSTGEVTLNIVEVLQQ